MQKKEVNPLVPNVRGRWLKLSLCITIGNEQESFVSLVESLLAQSRPPDEIIAVDGGSTDDTVELLHAYAARLRAEQCALCSEPHMKR